MGGPETTNKKAYENINRPKKTQKTNVFNEDEEGLKTNKYVWE